MHQEYQQEYQDCHKWPVNLATKGFLTAEGKPSLAAVLNECENLGWTLRCGLQDKSRTERLILHKQRQNVGSVLSVLGPGTQSGGE
jgi:hypothetical protein